jgi:Bacillus/Clostridium GerA spore germination protein.
MSSLFRAFFDWLRRGRAPAQHPSLDDRWVQRAIQERLAGKPASLVDEGLAGVRLGKDLKTNLSTLRRLAGDAPDLVVRHLHIAGGPEAAVVFFETLGRAELVANQVIKPLTHDAAQAGLRVPSSAGGLEAWIREQVINSARVTVETDLREVVREICHGKTALLVQGLVRAIIVELLGLDTRNVQEPVGEPVVRGPRDGFVESLQTNMSLIRRRVGSPLLRFERLLLGRWTKTPVVITYLRGLAPDELIEEVRRRITAIDIDGIIDTSYIEEFIEDTPYTVFPQVLNTERPDVVVANLLEGRVAIMAEGSPFALIVPTSLWALMNAAEDYYQRWDGATLVRLLRYALVALMLLFPSVYVAATTFHPEMLPSPMLISIAAAREAVPFSSFTEVLLMEITFEALREAGVRLPRPIGQTIGIVGAIVIGEAAVSAQIVSAPVVIIVAFTGISSFVVPHFNVGVAFRIARFFILILAGSLGLLGISISLMLLILHLAALRSFGQPYLAPVSPLRWPDLQDTVIRLPRWLMRKRPQVTTAWVRRRRDFPLRQGNKTFPREEGTVRAPGRD